MSDQGPNSPPPGTPLSTRTIYNSADDPMMQPDREVVHTDPNRPELEPVKLGTGWGAEGSTVMVEKVPAAPEATRLQLKTNPLTDVDAKTVRDELTPDGQKYVDAWATGALLRSTVQKDIRSIVSTLRAQRRLPFLGSQAKPEPMTPWDLEAAAYIASLEERRASRALALPAWALYALDLVAIIQLRVTENLPTDPQRLAAAVAVGLGFVAVPTALVFGSNAHHRRADFAVRQSAGIKKAVDAEVNPYGFLRPIVKAVWNLDIDKDDVALTIFQKVWEDERRGEPSDRWLFALRQTPLLEAERGLRKDAQGLAVEGSALSLD